MSESTRSVVVSAAEVKTRDGKTYKQGQAAQLPDVEARDLIRAGLVREASRTAEPQVAEKGGK